MRMRRGTAIAEDPTEGPLLLTPLLAVGGLLVPIGPLADRDEQ